MNNQWKIKQDTKSKKEKNEDWQHTEDFFPLIAPVDYLPSVATSSTFTLCFSAIYPSTEKMANPEKKLVTQFTVLVKRASLNKERTKANSRNKKRRDFTI